MILLGSADLYEEYSVTGTSVDAKLSRQLPKGGYNDIRNFAVSLTQRLGRRTNGHVIAERSTLAIRRGGIVPDEGSNSQDINTASYSNYASAASYQSILA